MHTHTHTLKDLQRKTVWLAVIIVLMTGVSVALVVLQPMDTQMRAAANTHIRHSLELKKLGLEQQFVHFLDIGRQIISRTQIRKRLADFNAGRTTLEDVRAYSTPRLEDALKEAEQALGMVRLDPHGVAVAVVGTAPPEPFRQTLAEQHQTPWLAGPLMIDGRLAMCAVTPIYDSDGTHQGTDIVMFRLDGLAATLKERGPTASGERKTYLLQILADAPPRAIGITPDGADLRFTTLPVTLPTRSELLATDLPDAPIHSLQSEDGRTWAVAVAPLSGVDLILVKMEPAATLYADARNTLYRVIAIIAVMVTVAALAVLRVLRVHSGQVLVKTEELKHEIDERKRAQQAAEKANQAKSQFLASMSHELRTPLNSIIGFAEMMEYQIKGPLPQAYQEYTTMITSSGRLLLETVNSILDLAKIEAGQFDLHPEPTYMGELLEEVLSLLSVQAKDKGLKLINEAHGVHHLQIDPVRIKQVLLNIIGNAIKFTEHGHVAISNHCDAEGHRLIVSDTGIGMTPEQVKIALEPFKQVHGTAFSRRYQGTGLGLSLSAQIMSLHGGRLTVDSAPGEGSRITLFFPRSLGDCGL